MAYTFSESTVAQSPEFFGKMFTTEMLGELVSDSCFGFEPEAIKFSYNSDHPFVQDGVLSVGVMLMGGNGEVCLSEAQFPFAQFVAAAPLVDNSCSVHGNSQMFELVISRTGMVRAITY